MFQDKTPRSRLRVRLILFLIILLTPFNSGAQDKVKNVVVFCAFSSNLPAFERFLSGLHSTINNSTGDPVNIITEYLDIGRSSDDYYPKSIISIYNTKLRTLTVDLLITVGPGVNNVLSKYGSSALMHLDRINVDFDMPGRLTLSDLKIENGKEILAKIQARNSIKHALDLFPDHKDVIVICGTSRLDSYFTSLMRQSKSEFERTHTFKFIMNLSMDSTIRMARTIPRNSIVFIPSYLLDGAGVPFSTPEALEMISKNSPAPVFPLTDAALGRRGGIGGNFFSYTNLGKEAGRVARQILNGGRPQNLEVDESHFYVHMYDWKELERWHLTKSKVIPASAIFYNREMSFLELYIGYILGTIAFILSQTLLIFYLYRLNKKQKAITEKMSVTDGMYRELVHLDRLSKMSILTASLSHELFQPLAAIRLTAQAGKQFIQAEKLDLNRASQMFDNILEDENRATKLMRSVKGLMKAETSDREIISLNALVNETIELTAADAKSQRIKINVLFEVDSVLVLGDKIQLQQVLMNFIRNAISAMEQNDPQNKTLEVALRSNTNDAIVSVRDSGHGLDPSVKEKLFKPFVTTKKDGFGIGLTLCKSLIENHLGKIWAEDVPGGGAKFSFSLPKVKV